MCVVLSVYSAIFGRLWRIRGWVSCTIVLLSVLNVVAVSLIILRTLTLENILKNFLDPIIHLYFVSIFKPVSLDLIKSHE